MTIVKPKTTITTTVTVHGETAPLSFGDKFVRTYAWNGERWMEEQSVKPLNWTQNDECPLYGSEESAYSAGFEDGQLQERLQILQEMAEHVANHDDEGFQDAVNVVWERMSEEDKEDTWPV